MSIIRSSRNPRLPQLQPLSARYNLIKKQNKKAMEGSEGRADMHRLNRLRLANPNVLVFRPGIPLLVPLSTYLSTPHGNCTNLPLCLHVCSVYGLVIARQGRRTCRGKSHRTVLTVFSYSQRQLEYSDVGRAHSAVDLRQSVHPTVNPQ